jgi:hypothetical protein
MVGLLAIIYTNFCSNEHLPTLCFWIFPIWTYVEYYSGIIKLLK